MNSVFGSLLGKSASASIFSGNGVFRSYLLQTTRNATKKAGGSTKNGRDSPGQRLGVKKFGGEIVVPGNILIRQRGRKVRCGDNVKMGRDHTIYSVKEGWVHFKYDKFKKYQIISVSDLNPNIPPGTIPTPKHMQSQ